MLLLLVVDKLPHDSLLLAKGPGDRVFVMAIGCIADE